MTELSQFIDDAFKATDLDDLAFTIEVSTCHCTPAGLRGQMYEKAVEVTDRAHAMGYDTDVHRYFKVPLRGYSSYLPLEKLHHETVVEIKPVDGVLRPCASGLSTPSVDEAVARISRGNGSEWYVTKLSPGPLIPREECCRDNSLQNKRMSAAEAKELGFQWAYVEEQL